MNNIAIITARGGSKRIPKKNIKNFCGKPIIAYSIEAALNSGLFDEVMVSTDDEEIATIAKAYGAKVPFLRSEKNSDDYSTTADVLAEVLGEYQRQGQIFAVMCCLYPTAPFLTAQKLNQAYKQLKEMNANALIPVVPFSFPPQRCFSLQKDKLTYKWPQNMNVRSQDLEKLYHDAGQFYFGVVQTFMKEKTLFTNNTTYLLLKELEVQDIDTQEDWEIAELKYNLYKKS